ncbi:Arabinanase/levansucrase/invertase [Violaceomyces palustris]|uniref:Arabinanase/levansucrase/invertase n=1 Tax=Violaceomyces palustris TaxID=1673888 RepID=A0ACD0NV71_9BASI|nr:Arabinanase/levansucrase/invertase [Violaceomyces palustris]
MKTTSKLAIVYQNPVIDSDFPDPGVVFDSLKARWHAFSTNSDGINVPVAQSDDLVHWTKLDVDALPYPHPEWTGKPGFYWAPDVVKSPTLPGWLMYLATHDRMTGKQSVAVAHSPTDLAGPYRFVGDGPIVSQADLGGTIDPQCFLDPITNRSYLLFKNDGNNGELATTRLWVQQLSDDGLRLQGPRSSILEPSKPWHRDLVEAPYMYYHKSSSTYVLFYSSGSYSDDSYAINYATSKSLEGPFESSDGPLLNSSKERNVRGPGGQCIVEKTGGKTFLIYHAWDEPGDRNGRRMCITRLDWMPNGEPFLPRPPSYRAWDVLDYDSGEDDVGSSRRHLHLAVEAKLA